MTTPAPIAGNQNFTQVVDLSSQLPTLNVANLDANTLSTNSGDIRLLTYGENPVTTLVVGTVTADGSGYQSVLDSETLLPLTLPQNTEVFNVHYICPDANFVQGAGTIDIGLGDISIPSISQAFVATGTDAIANATTGGYVQGTLVAGNTQAFGGTGDGAGGSTLVVNVGAANEVIVRLAANAVGTLLITIQYTLRRS